MQYLLSEMHCFKVFLHKVLSSRSRLLFCGVFLPYKMHDFLLAYDYIRYFYMQSGKYVKYVCVNWFKFI